MTYLQETYLSVHETGFGEGKTKQNHVESVESTSHSIPGGRAPLPRVAEKVFAAETDQAAETGTQLSWYAHRPAPADPRPRRWPRLTPAVGRARRP